MLTDDGKWKHRLAIVGPEPDRLTDDEIRAILEGTKGVTLGPWAGEFDDGDFCSYIQAAGLFVARSRLTADAAHIARCDPTTIAELCNRLLSAEARVRVLEDALLRLSFMAQTSGGAAGRDEELCAAIAAAQAELGPKK
jgi:hypothetical protein